MKVTLWGENASAVNWHDMPLARCGSAMMEVPGTVLKSIRLNQHLWAHCTSSELWVPSFPKRHFIFVPSPESCQPTDTSFSCKNAGSAWTEKQIHAALLRALMNRNITQHTRSDPYHCFTMLHLAGAHFFLPCPFSAFHFTAWTAALHMSDWRQVTSLWSPTLLWLVSNYSWSGLGNPHRHHSLICGEQPSNTALLSDRNGTSTVSFLGSFLTHWSLHA